MKNYSSVREFKDSIKDFPKEYIELLKILEEVNPCSQSYDYENGNLMISYKLKLNLFNFLYKYSFYKIVRIIGFPISISEKGYFGNKDVINKTIQSKKGLTIVLNADNDLNSENKTLSAFIFDNKYNDFKEYIECLRSPYRRRINKALDKRDRLLICKIPNTEFSEVHYSLYRNVMNRTKNPLETLPIEYFRRFDSDIYEIRDNKSNNILAFFQLKEIESTLYFLFCGFKREDNEDYDLYYNLLLLIIEIGIKRKVKYINFGQTSEESKLKIGCKEQYKYIYVHHSNPILNKILNYLIPYFSYKPIVHKYRVFKKDE